MIQKGEIVYCNLIVRDKKKNKLLTEVVYKEVDGFYKNQEVVSIDIIKRLGFENNTKDYDLAIKNDEKRNNVTGAYE